MLLAERLDSLALVYFFHDLRIWSSILAMIVLSVIEIGNVVGVPVLMLSFSCPDFWKTYGLGSDSCDGHALAEVPTLLEYPVVACRTGIM
jgi:hypothetical protein